MDPLHRFENRPGRQLVVSRLCWFRPGPGVQTALVVTVGMVPHERGFARGNRSKGCFGMSAMTVENHQREGLLW